MKKFTPGIMVFFILCFSALNLSNAVMTEKTDVEKYPFCKYCGMDRNTFAYSRMLIEYDDASNVGLCSLHCAVIDIALNIDTPITHIMVGDQLTHKLINAETAYWVIGGEKAGVMTKRAKWAFENSWDAGAFVTENGGSLAVFDEVLKTAYEDMYEDIKMLRKKRQIKHN